MRAIGEGVKEGVKEDALSVVDGFGSVHTTHTTYVPYRSLLQWASSTPIIRLVLQVVRNIKIMQFGKDRQPQ